MTDGRRVLVTGGAGFIGSNIVDGLVAAGHVVQVVDDLSRGTAANLAHAIVEGDVALHEIDVRSPDLAQVFEAFRPDAVVHLAAQIDVRVSVADPCLDADVNIVGTLNVLERARGYGVRKVVIASSGGCIYGEEQEWPVAESAVGVPVSPYGISKKVLSDYATYYRQVHGLESAILAMSNVYGPRQDPHGEAGVVAIFLRAMAEGRPTTIYGDGSQTRDLVYVGDVVQAFLRALETGVGVFNIGTGIETSVLDLWDACATVTGYLEAPTFAPQRTGELARSALDATRAGREFDWIPKVGLSDGIGWTRDFIAAGLATNSTAVS